MVSGVGGRICAGVLVYVFVRNSVSFCLRGGLGCERSL